MYLENYTYFVTSNKLSGCQRNVDNFGMIRKHLENS